MMSGCGRLGSCSSGGVGSTGGEWNSVPVRRTKHLWWVRPKWLYAKAAVRVTHARDVVPRGSQWSRAAPDFSAFPQRLLFEEVFSSKKSSLPRIGCGTQTLQETPPYLTVRRFKGAGSRTSRVQLGSTRCEGVAVQTSHVSIVLWFRNRPVGGGSPIKARGSGTVAHGSHVDRSLRDRNSSGR